LARLTDWLLEWVSKRLTILTGRKATDFEEADRALALRSVGASDVPDGREDDDVALAALEVVDRAERHLLADGDLVRADDELFVAGEVELVLVALVDDDRRTALEGLADFDLLHSDTRAGSVPTDGRYASEARTSWPLRMTQRTARSQSQSAVSCKGAMKQTTHR